MARLVAAAHDADDRIDADHAGALSRAQQPAVADAGQHGHAKLQSATASTRLGAGTPTLMKQTVLPICTRSNPDGIVNQTNGVTPGAGPTLQPATGRDHHRRHRRGLDRRCWNQLVRAWSRIWANARLPMDAVRDAQRATKAELVELGIKGETRPEPRPRRGVRRSDQAQSTKTKRRTSTSGGGGAVAAIRANPDANLDAAGQDLRRQGRAGICLSEKRSSG